MKTNMVDYKKTDNYCRSYQIEMVKKNKETLNTI